MGPIGPVNSWRGMSHLLTLSMTGLAAIHNGFPQILFIILSYKPYQFIYLAFQLSVSVCVCVCVKERDRQKQRLRDILGACELVCAFVDVGIPVCVSSCVCSLRYRESVSCDISLGCA